MDADMFTEGSIYWYENKTNTKDDYKNKTLNHDFVCSRPVYILKSNPSPFNNFSVNVLVITSSQRRIGVPINITGIRDGKILPYEIRSIHKEYLTKYMGQASKEIMTEVNESVQYHLGFSLEKPSYMKDYEELEETINKTINSLTIKEKSVYDFLQDKCILNNEFYSKTDELYKLYQKYNSQNKYSRMQDFCRTINKLIAILPCVSCKTVNQEKIYYGIAINGNLHRIEVDQSKVEKNRKIIESDVIKVLPEEYDKLQRSQLIDLLSDKSKKAYHKMDIVQKIENYNVNPNKLKINNIDKNDVYILRELINRDFQEKKKVAFKLLDNGLNPVNLSSVNQYVLYKCSNDELVDHISDRYLQHGGIHKLRKLIYVNIKHFGVPLKRR